MPIPQQADVKAIIGDFESRLRAVVERAWQEWMGSPHRMRIVFRRTCAVMVFDFIARHALSEFDGDSNIRAIAKNPQTVHFLFKDTVLVRFKKGNAKGVGSNIETQGVLNFIDPQRAIPGLVPEIMKIEICYTPDDIGVDLDEVAVVARDQHRPLWRYAIERNKPAAEVINIPPRAPDLTPAAVVPREQTPDEKTEDKE